jgi:hypothetical protein
MRSQEPESRSQEDRRDERPEGAALTLVARPGGISPYHVLRLRNVKTGGSRPSVGPNLRLLAPGFRLLAPHS